jgi:DedD protein
LNTKPILGDDMMSNESPIPDEEGESARTRRRLLWRMGLAGLMIVALLGGLALFDYLATGRSELEDDAPPHFTEPIPVKPVTQALGPVVPMPDEEEEAEKQESPEIPDTSVPESTAAPAIPLADTLPADVAPTASSQKAPPVRAPTKPPTRTAAPSSTPPVARVERKESQTPVLPRPETSRQEPPRVDAPRALPSRQSPAYTLQAGVFADPRRAEEIHAKLVEEGIPVALETRVLVGPFKSRSEAESARAKMKAMGIDALLMPRNERK